MSKKIYVGNMNYDTTESRLSELFGEFGSVLSAKVIEDQFTGRSKGFGFVEMENEEEALNAINSLNGKEVDSRTLKVNEAFDKPRRDRGDRGDRGGNRGGGYNRDRF